MAIIETNEAHGVYGDEPKEAWVVLTSLKVVLGLRVMARSLTPGNMDLDIKVAGPYGFYDPLPAAKSSLSFDAEAALTLLANYVTPEMVDAPLQVHTDQCRLRSLTKLLIRRLHVLISADAAAIFLVSLACSRRLYKELNRLQPVSVRKCLFCQFSSKRTGS